MKLSTEQPGKLRARVFQEKDPVQYFTDFTKKIVTSPKLKFRLMFKGTSEENRFASSLGSTISVQKVPEVLQKLRGTQFSLRCEPHSGAIPLEIIFELYDDNIEISAPDSFEEKIISIISDE